LNEIRKIVLSKEEFKKDTQILKKNQTKILKMKSSISQIKKLSSSSVEELKLKTEYQGLKTK
jgi:hypothetical protein